MLFINKEKRLTKLFIDGVASKMIKNVVFLIFTTKICVESKYFFPKLTLSDRIRVMKINIIEVLQKVWKVILLRQ